MLIEIEYVIIRLIALFVMNETAHQVVPDALLPLS